MLAQLIERFDGIEEAASLNLAHSTTFKKPRARFSPASRGEAKVAHAAERLRGELAGARVCVRFHGTVARTARRDPHKVE